MKDPVPFFGFENALAPNDLFPVCFKKRFQRILGNDAIKGNGYAFKSLGTLPDSME